MPLLALAVGGCHSVVEIPAPAPTGSHGSQVLVLLRDGTPERVYAAPATPETQLPDLTIRADDRLDLFLLYFDCDLGAIGLVSGWQELATPEKPGDPLPSPTEILTGRLEPDHALSWSPASALPSGVTTLRLSSRGSRNLCAQFEVSPPIALPDSTNETATFALALDDQSALVATTGGRFYRVTVGHAEPLTGLSTTTPHYAGFKDDAGVIWLVGEGGRVVRGDFERGFEDAGTTATATSVGPGFAMAGGPGSPPELFVVGSAFSFDHYSGGRWDMIEPPNPEFRRRDEMRPGLLWLGPEEVLAIGLRERAVLHFDHGMLTEEPLASMARFNVVRGIALIPRIGVVTSIFSGTYFVRGEGGVWQTLAEGGPRGAAAIYPFRRGFVAGMSAGAFVEYDPALGFCPPVQVAPHRITTILRFGDWLLTVSTRDDPFPSGEDATVTFVRPLLPSDTCSGDGW